MAKGPKVPEHVLKKRKTLEAVAAKKAKDLVVTRAANKVERKSIFEKAAKYAKEYKTTEKDLVRNRREAKKCGNFFMEPEPKLVAVIRIKGINAVDPKSRKILQLMRLRQVPPPWCRSHDSAGTSGRPRGAGGSEVEQSGRQFLVVETRRSRVDAWGGAGGARIDGGMTRARAMGKSQPVADLFSRLLQQSRQCLEQAAG